MPLHNAYPKRLKPLRNLTWWLSENVVLILECAKSQAHVFSVLLCKLHFRFLLLSGVMGLRRFDESKSFMKMTRLIFLLRLSYFERKRLLNFIYIHIAKVLRHFKDGSRWYDNILIFCFIFCPLIVTLTDWTWICKLTVNIKNLSIKSEWKVFRNKMFFLKESY